MPFHPSLPIHSKIGLPLQASKWLKCPLLVDSHEMEALLNALSDFRLFLISGPTRIQEGEISKEEFLDCYRCYIEALKNGQLPQDSRLRSYFSCAFTQTIEALYAVHINSEQQLIKVNKPVIQLQSHRFDYSKADGKFRSMVFGNESIYWGIQFSYPQLYQDAAFQVKTVRESEEFPNTALFKRLQKWMREHTVATPFFVEGKRVNVPIRLGKACFAWINHHPQLALKGLQVMT
ncbi:hypothetical protein [Candidatus Protochlamydia phocaeensis]|uniref:hypothetical protein n=1 Tax=Candidatus Protochlamydia phocaeensis TaxID=1414722 RepID=UPI000837ABDE|nr:hypothetical protein [Candidatus Protochlamydia phocaeensis]